MLEESAVGSWAKSTAPAVYTLNCLFVFKIIQFDFQLMLPLAFLEFEQYGDAEHYYDEKLNEPERLLKLRCLYTIWLTVFFNKITNWSKDSICSRSLIPLTK